MIDDSLPDAPPDDSGASKVYVSLASVATQDGTPPAMGDEVEFTCRGSVSSVEGDVACVTPSEINGEPAPQAPMMADKEPDAMDEHDRLMNQAQQDDNY